MADIPRVPQVIPPALVNPQVHRVDRASDRNPRQHREEEKPQEDILELHEVAEAPAEPPPSPQPAAGEDHLDIAI